MAGSVERQRGRSGHDAWPSYVDALATLLMVIIFVLLVFVLAQGFLSAALSSRDRALERLHRQVAELAEMLALERTQTEELRGSLARVAAELTTTAAARDTALRQLAGLREERDRLLAERDLARGEQERLAARLADLGVVGRGTAERVAELERQLAEAVARAEALGRDAARRGRDLLETRRGLVQSEAQRSALEREIAARVAELEATRAELARLRAEREELNRRVHVDRATLEARLADVARLHDQVRALTALRDALERQAQEALARAAGEERARRSAEHAAAQAAAARTAAEQRAAMMQRHVEEAEVARRRAESEMREAVERAARAELARQRAEEIARQAASVQAAAERARAEAEREAAQRIALAERARAEALAHAEGAEARAREQTQLAESAQARIALLTAQVEALRAEIARLITALEREEAAGRDREAQITLLGQRLNAALAARVEELQRYRSDFFGRLREVLGERPEVRIVGDRFVIQGEVLFAPGQAELSEEGRRRVFELARVLKEIAAQIPPDIPWVLRIDGHADRTPIRSPRFASNWELAAQRAIAVVQMLIGEGLPPERLAATSFGDTQPLDPADTPAAYARNRRIEFRLTDR